MNIQQLNTGHYFGRTNSKIHFDDFVLSENHHQANSRIPKHLHKNPYMTYAVEGQWKECNNYHERLVTANSIYLHGNNEVHSDEFLDQDVRLFNIEFNNEEHTEHLNENIELNRLISGTILKIYTEFQLNDPFSKLILIGLCIELTGLLHRLRATQIHRSHKQWISDLKQHIDENYLNEFDLNLLANEFNVSPIHASRAFTEHFGQTISEYIMKLKIDYSIDLMKEKSLSLSQVALESGFYDSSHFNRNFKRFTSVTPSHYRKQYVN